MGRLFLYFIETKRNLYYYGVLFIQGYENIVVTFNALNKLETRQVVKYVVDSNYTDAEYSFYCLENLLNR